MTTFFPFLYLNTKFEIELRSLIFHIALAKTIFEHHNLFIGFCTLNGTPNREWVAAVSNFFSLIEVTIIIF